MQKHFEVGSKFAETHEMSEQEKAKFSLLLVKHFNLARQRSQRIEQKQLFELQLAEEQEILRKRQAQIEAYLQSKIKLNSAKKRQDRSRSNSSSPGPRYQYQKKDANLRPANDVSNFVYSNNLKQSSKQHNLNADLFDMDW